MKNFKQVDEHLYRSGKLNKIDLLKIKDLGIKKIISLDKEDGNDIKSICKELGLDQKIIDVDISNNKSMKKLLNSDIVGMIQDDGPTLVHCHAGKDRTGTVVAIYSLLTGQDIKEVMKKLFYFGFGIGLPKSAKEFYLKAINHVNREIKRLKQPKELKEDSLDNADSIIGLSARYMDDPQFSYVEPPTAHSFTPYMDYSRSFPYDVDYNPYNGVVGSDKGSRAYKLQQLGKKYKENVPHSESNNTLPLVGLYYNDINATRLGPLDMSGLFYD